MDRVDSGFYDSSHSRGLGKEPPSIQRSNTAPTRHHKPKRASTEPSSTRQSTDRQSRRSTSEKCSNAHPRPSQSRRKSIASSSENSTSKSRTRGCGSKPSSRRTSCTIVDPSRPARHYRIRSSQTVPTANQDIDDVLALHFRSCSLFNNPTYHSPSQSRLSSPTISGYGVGLGLGVDPDIAISKRTSPNSPTITATAPQPETNEIEVVEKRTESQESEEMAATTDIANTTMHWMSPSTRRREYKKIDRANSGFRGLMRKVVPTCVSGPPPPRFYEQDRSDIGSVRRFRMDVSDDEVDEKSTSSLRLQSRRLEKFTTTNTTKKYRWGCF